MKTRGRTAAWALFAALLAAAAVAAISTRNHSLVIDVPGATVCVDGATFSAQTTASSALGVGMTAQVFDSAGTTLQATGNSHTFTSVGESFLFTVLYPAGTFAVGDAVGLSVTDNPGTLFGTEGDFDNSATVADCSLSVPTLPVWAYGLLALLLAAAAWRILAARGERHARRLLVLVVSSLGLSAAAGATEPTVPQFSKEFAPGTIGPGSTSTLIFTITNNGSHPVGDLAFTDTLPMAVTIAPAPAASTTCGGSAILGAPAGGGTISFSGGTVGAFASCVVRVNVVSSTPGTHTNVSGALTSDAGSSGTATADLVVATTRPGFIKAFAPSTVEFGDLSTLTFTIDNTANASAETDLDFTDTLPAGMVIASPANASTSCGSPPTAPATLVASPGTNVVSLSYFGITGFPGVAAGQSCTVVVDVVGGAVGRLGNVSSDLLLSGDRSAGKASAALEVTGVETLLEIRKRFTDDPVPPGGTVTLQFTITNRSRDAAATGITFDDTIDPMGGLGGLTPSLPPTPDPPCGAGSMLGFAAGTLTLTGGNLPAEGSCTFSVQLSVPSSAMPGAYTNTTTAVSGTVGGSPETGNMAGDQLFVVAFPVLTKEFTDDPVGAGGTVTLEFTITNTATSAATAIAFIDELTDGSGGFPPDTTSGFLPSPVSVTIPPGDPCGPGSSLALVSLGTDRQGLSLTGGQLAAAGMGGDSCIFSVTVGIPAGFASGTYTNTTEEITATVGGDTVTGKPASDDIVVVGTPQITKEFTDDPATPGGTVTLEFTLENLDDTNTASAIAFTDDLTTVLAGLTASSVASNTCTGATVDISTPTSIDVSGGTLAAGASCTIQVVLSVPPIPGGIFPNTTSSLTATVAGVTATSPGASDNLVVTGLIFTKEFVGDPVIAGGTATLTFTLDNTGGTASATDIFFTDNLDDVVPGLVATLPPTPDPPCGPGSLLLGPPTGAGGTLLFLIGGEVAAGALCSFSVTVTVPTTIPNPSPPPADIATPDGVYPNTTSDLSTMIGGSGVVLPPAVDDLIVESTLLEITKAFTDDPVAPGDTVTLQFTLENLSAIHTVTDIAFADDLGAALSGLQATGATFNDCGGMATSIFPTGLFTYAGGTLTPSATCTIVLSVDVPAAPLASSPPYVNTTSGVTGKVGMLDVFGDPASDRLRVQLFNLTKAFDGPTTAGSTAVITFTLQSLDAANAASDLAFSDDLSMVVPGLVATLPPIPDPPCGPGSALAGTSFLTLSGASLPPSGSCSFDVTVTIPAGAPDGTFVNTTSGLFRFGLQVADPATALLSIEPPPVFSKSFAPATIPAGTLSTLTFTIDNAASALPASGLDFTDSFPAGVVVANPANAATTCGGGIVTALSGTAVVAYSGGTVAAMSSCTVSVDVTTTASGVFGNVSGDLTSSSGNSGTAADTLTAIAPSPPAFSKSFSPDPIGAGEVSTLTFTIDNTSSGLPATSLDFTDNLPAAIAVANPANAATNCIGGGLSAVPGSSVVTYTGGAVAAASSCAVSVDVTSATPGMHVNTTGDLTSSLGTSGTATDTLQVDLEPPLFSKQFSPDPVGQGFETTLTFTIDNSASALDATNLTFLDTLPIGLEVAPSPMVGNGCGGAVVAAGGSVSISLSGGTVSAGGVCTISVRIVAVSFGVFDNVSGDLTSSLGNSGPASDSLTVNECLAADGVDLTLGDQVVLVPLTREVCRTVTIQEHFLVLGPNGLLRLRVGVSVVIENGVEIRAGGQLVVEIDPLLVP